MLRRDPITGLVSTNRTNKDPAQNPYYTDPKFGELRRALLDLEADAPRSRPRSSEPPTLFAISPDDPILRPNEDTQSDQALLCPNGSDRPGMQLNPITNEHIPDLVDIESSFMNRLAHLCWHAGIRRCESPSCVANRNRLETLAPRCDWTPFRDWALQLLSCQVTMLDERRFTKPFFHMCYAVSSCHYFVVDAKARGERLPSTLLAGEGRTKAPIDAFGAFEMVYWMMTIHFSFGFSAIIERGWNVHFLPANITEPAVAKASERARDLGICQNRFWNLVFATERQHIDLPAIIDSASLHPRLKHENHDMCTAVFCRSTDLDATKVKQLHKCEDPVRDPCKEHLFFDPEKLNHSIRNKGRTVWSSSSPDVSQNDPYIAISHVWSDGTGIGQQKPGLVNRCLFKSLARIAERLDCPGIWWDTISIPEDPVLRRAAINDMHRNYEDAKCTVLHDCYLLNFEWTNDGAPCLALILSPWFTRGWTALELIMSKTIKVLFKGPTDDEPLIKDLDEDILAKDPARCTRGHWIASTIIRRLRRDIGNVSDLVAVLKPRSTSWARDRLVIAGLLSKVGVDYKLRPHEITKMIIDKVAKLHPASLHHGQPTITTSGGWSWCPLSLYEMPSENVGDLSEEGTVGDNTCAIDKDGVLVGFWHWRPLEKQDSINGQLLPNSQHSSVILGIRVAIRRWEYCMLLRDNNMGDGPALIVIPVGQRGGYISVKYVGSVHEVSPSGSRFDDRFDFDRFRIGGEGDQKEAKAAKFRDPRNIPKKPSSKNYAWICDKIWMGDQDNTGQLLLARNLKNDGIIEGYSVRISRNKDTQGSGNDRKNKKYGVTLSHDPVFCVWAESGQGVDGEGTDSTIGIRRMNSDDTWPPQTIPAFERVYKDPKHDYRSSSIFRLRNGPDRRVYAAISTKYLTPDQKYPYRGIWIVASPDHRPSFALFHQPYPSSLEAIALTGDKKNPRGTLYFVVEDLNEVRNHHDGKGEWQGRPVVRATFPTPDDMPPPDVEINLLLASQEEVVWMTPQGWTHFYRVNVSEYMDLLKA